MKKSKDSIELWLEQGIDVPTRTLMLFGEVDEALLDRATSAFHLFSAKTDPVTVLLNSPGGDVAQGMAIYDLIKNSEAPVTIRVVGEACSMGAVILQAGDVREAYENSVIMHHVGEMSFSGHAENVKLNQQFEVKYGNRIDLIMLESINEKLEKDGQKPKTMAWWKKHDLWDRWLTADEAIEMGLLDSIYKLKAKK